ncbi:5'/3'-nucleotidase SurE [Marinivivus vitaminiproducens]|uniref:5'/3'-nucleotidase SurE n=1 Tax=Marinivivus vitaminiproducens TaxID=3035935 RepID=UPI0027A32981|nr:5'/3'-nucleotidase SurE [Geminicoccaceae bacterium SCSIO 64248]
MPLSRPLRILLTNDDGISAPGLAVLREIAATISDDVFVVAPETNQSGTSHALTIRRPLRARRVAEREWAIDGTPTDCVMLALQGLLPADQGIDLVLSGVNRGANVAEDVTYSGTIGAAMEASLFNIPAIALSQVYIDIDTVPWSAARVHGPKVVRTLLAAGWPGNIVQSVNFPACEASEVKGVRVMPHGWRKLGDEIVEREDPRGESYYWIGHLRSKPWDEPGTDLAAVNDGYVSVTPIHLDLTHHASLDRLRSAFDGIELET